MKWRRASFKEKDVWVAVGDDGAPLAEGGRVPIRYSKRAGAKVYRAGASRVSVHDGAAVEALDEGAAADAASPRKAAGAGGRGRGFGKAGTRTASQASAAKAEARRLLAELPEGTIVAFTDGACRGNPGPAGSGVRVEHPDGRVVEACRALGRGTNNVAELTAVDLALDVLEGLGVASDAPVALLSDSDYTHGVLCRGWKAKANRELILGLRERLAGWPGVVIHWVAGHAGVAGNERADALANLGVDGQTLIREAI